MIAILFLALAISGNALLLNEIGGFERYTPLNYVNTWRLFNGLQMFFLKTDGDTYTFSLNHYCKKCGQFGKEVFRGKFTVVKKNGTIFEGIAEATGSLRERHFIGLILLTFAKTKNKPVALYFIPIPDQLASIGSYATRYHSLVYSSADVEEIFPEKRQRQDVDIYGRDPPKKPPVTVTPAPVVMPKANFVITVHIIIDHLLYQKYLQEDLMDELPKLAQEHIDGLQNIVDQQFESFNIKFKLAREQEVLKKCEDFCDKSGGEIINAEDEYFNPDKAMGEIFDILAKMSKKRQRRASMVVLFTFRQFGHPGTLVTLGQVRNIGRVGECRFGTNTLFVSFKDNGALRFPSFTSSTFIHECLHMLGAWHDEPEFVKDPGCWEGNYIMNPVASGKDQELGFEMSSCTKKSIMETLNGLKKWRPAYCIDFSPADGDEKL